MPPKSYYLRSSDDTYLANKRGALYWTAEVDCAIRATSPHQFAAVLAVFALCGVKVSVVQLDKLENDQ